MTNLLKAAVLTATAMAKKSHRALAGAYVQPDGMAYLNEATDRIDLELRIRELEKPRQGFYQTDFSVH